MSVSSDPSMTDTPTLIRSVKRDLGEALRRMREADAFLREASSTMFEIERREATKATDTPADGGE